MESYVADRSDLAAQWAMAHYTFVGLIIGLIGIGFILWTLIEGRRAAYFTEVALNTTKDTSYKELRAYLGVRVDCVPVDNEMKHLAVNTVILNHGQTPAYNIRLVYSLFNGMAQWGPMDRQTTAILNPNESFHPTLESKFENAQIVAQQDTIFLNFDIIFTDMNGKERWLKMNFSKPGNKWPVKVTTIRKPRNTASGRFEAIESFEGTTELYLVKMETGDLQPEKPYEM